MVAGEGPARAVQRRRCRASIWADPGHRSDRRSRSRASTRAGQAAPATRQRRAARRLAAPSLGRIRKPTQCRRCPSPHAAVRRRDQHPHPPRPAVLPVSVDARRRDHRARGRPAPRRRQERHRQRGILPGPLSGRAAHARRADARIAVAGGGDSAAAARGRAAERPRLPARRQRREVPPPGRPRATGCGSRSRSAAAARRSRARRPPRTSAIRSSPKPSCCSAWCPTAPRSIRRRSCIPRAQIGAGHDDRAARRRSARTCASAPNCRSARRRSSTAGPRSATAREIYPVRVDRPDPAGPQVPRRGDPAGRSAAATSSASS